MEIENKEAGYEPHYYGHKKIEEELGARMRYNRYQILRRSVSV